MAVMKVGAGERLIGLAAPFGGRLAGFAGKDAGEDGWR